MPLPIEYDILVEANGQSTRIGWGDCPQWAARHKAELDAADYISLLPKDGADLPVVVLAKPEDAKWIVFSRVFGKIGAGVAQPQFRCYALGYQWNHDARPKEMRTHLVWIYPNGTVEVGAEPSLARFLLRQR